VKLDEPTEAESVVLAAAVEALRRRCEGPPGGDEAALVMVVSRDMFTVFAVLGRVEREVITEQPIRDTLAQDIVEGFRLFNAGGSVGHDAEALGDAPEWCRDLMSPAGDAS
jgi:hypothetical protein